MISMRQVQAVLALCGLFALVAAWGCEPSDNACDGCDGEMQNDALCLVALDDLPGASGGQADAVPGDAGSPAGASRKWQSAPWQNAEWTSLPGKTRVRLEHDLGREPDSVDVYLSFEKDDSDREGTRSSFPAAGDMARITDVTDSTITIKNNTEQSFCLRVVLE
jgi:hypothetical protein